MSDQRVSCTIEAGIADVRLDRPDKHNGLDPAMFDAIVEVGERVRGDASVRVVILSGNGPSFCSGLDFKAFMTGGAAVRDKLLSWREDRIGNLAQRLAWVWTEVPAPVIAAVLLLKAGVEERAMIERHPGYRDYQRGTKRFVPWVG